MMRGALWTLVLLAAAAAVAILLQNHGGNVVIVAQPWRIELSLVLAVALILLAFVLLHILLRVAGWLGSSPQRLRSWRNRRLQKKDVNLLQRAWAFMLQGEHAPAEKELASLLARTRSGERKVLASLGLARALHQRAETERRDAALQQAKKFAAGNARRQKMVDLVHAEILLDENKAKAAVDLLRPWQDKKGSVDQLQRLMLRAWQQLGDARQVYELTRQLVRRNAMDARSGRKLIVQSGIRLLDEASESDWKKIWGQLGAEERLEPRLALAGARAQDRWGHPKEAARILEAALERGLDEQLLRAYSHCDPEQARHRLGRAEQWLKSHPDDPDLLAALGQLCLQARLWGQGEHYLNRSLALRADTHVHALLGNLSHALGRTDDALRHWRQACAAADAIIPEIRRQLPAADTHLDPQPFSAGFAASDKIASPEAPLAASAVYLQDEAQLSAEQDAAPVAHKGSAAADEQTDNDYFDTAPIPGVDMSKTSDSGRSR